MKAITVSISVELLETLSKKGSRNANLIQLIQDYIIHKPKAHDMRKFNCISTTSFTLRFRDPVLFNAFENECQVQFRERSNMLSIMLASMT